MSSVCVCVCACVCVSVCVCVCARVCVIMRRSELFLRCHLCVLCVLALLYRLPDAVFIRGVGANERSSVSSGMGRHSLHLHTGGGEDPRGLSPCVCVCVCVCEREFVVCV